MNSQRYAVNQHLIETILVWVKSDEIAIPEIQRPFVWDSAKVRDLMDSLYQGYPIGYLIAWKNPDMKLKDGTSAEGRKILIDGQQRVMALKAAILGHYVINKSYKRIRIRISFHPGDEKFEVFNNAIAKDASWIPDIAEIFSPNVSIISMVDRYLSKNGDTDKDFLYGRIEKLGKIIQKQIGMIELDSGLDIETVTEIFIRINSQGVVLSQADFAMSKIASGETYNGSTIRKAIDYFCHLAIAPEFYSQIVEVDEEFPKTDYFRKMKWLKNENDNIYDPKHTDLLRVAFTSEFERGRLSDLVNLLSGRNFEKRTYEEEIARNSFARLEKGIFNFINENNFKKFVMIIKSAGFVASDLIRSQNTLNFAYIIYLKLRANGSDPASIEKAVRRWFVMSILTGRYSGSSESEFDRDIRRIATKQFAEVLDNVEQGELSDTFWSVTLPQAMNTSAASSPVFNTYLASQVKAKDHGFLSTDITVSELVTLKGDKHHIFPRDYLRKHDHKRRQYNQIANYVIMQSEINIKVGNKAPNEYFDQLRTQCSGGDLRYGGIHDMDTLRSNLAANCIPESVFEMDVTNYQDFLTERRLLMATKIRDYYFSL